MLQLVAAIQVAALSAGLALHHASGLTHNCEQECHDRQASCPPTQWMYRVSALGVNPKSGTFELPYSILRASRIVEHMQEGIGHWGAKIILIPQLDASCSQGRSSCPSGI